MRLRKTLTKQVLRQRRIGALVHQAVHRISFAGDDGADYWSDVEPIPDAELDGPKLLQRFGDARKVPVAERHHEHEWRDRPGAATGGVAAYTFLVKQSGEVDQMTPVTAITAHARKWNATGIGIAVAGDFRRAAPNPEQYAALVELCALWRAQGLTIVGHDELIGGSADPNKRCPGDRLSLEDLRSDVRRHRFANVPAKEAESFLVEQLGVEL